MKDFHIAAERMRMLSRTQAPLSLSDKLPFSCRRICGHLCCGDLSTPIHIFPPEYFRIHWHFNRLQRDLNLEYPHAFISDKEHVSGLSILKLDFQDFYWQGEMVKACPFLLADDAVKQVPMTTCAVHHARPHTCRVFPVGMVMDGWFNHQQVRTTYYIMSFCPGFEFTNEDENGIETYKPISLKQTMQDWLKDQMNPEQYEEIIYFFFEVLTYYHAQGWHKPTHEHPRKGVLTMSAYNQLANVFYEVPPCPSQPTEDHAAIMQRLSWLREEAQSIVENAQEQAK